MSNFAIIRLGKDSIADIKVIDALHESPSVPITFTVHCKQVPNELAAGDYVFFCFGSDNSQGAPTEWVRGVRALGTIVSKTGGPGYNDPWQVSVEIKVVLPQSIVRKDLLAHAPTAYYWCSGIPTIGIEANSQQTIQMIKVEEPNQNIAALAYGIAAHSPVFKIDTIKAYPDLENLFNYQPPSPVGPPVATILAGAQQKPETIPELLKKLIADSINAGLRFEPRLFHSVIASLLAKKILILTGLAGSGKTKLAQAIARWITPVRLTLDAFSPGAIIPSERTTYFVSKSDLISVEFWNSNNEAESTKVTLSREMIAEWADYIQKNSIPETTTAREIREAVKKTSKFSDQLHSFETHLKAAAFALLKCKTETAQGKCYEVVPVGADWTGNENVLGYPNGLDENSYVAKPALELILHAMNHPGCPHFLILDEMNMSHVERYFADILSIIESGEELELYAGDMDKPDTWRQTAATGRIPPKLKRLPENLFIIGTVNVDETTYMFSPKVLDRANVIEFRMETGELEEFLYNPAKPELSNLDGKGEMFIGAFVDAAKKQVAVHSDVKVSYDSETLLFFKTLQAHGAEFGYRTVYETARFIHFYKLLGNHPDGNTSWFSEAFDCVVFQKFLPKLHGSRAKIGPVLKKLWFLCVNNAAGRGTDPFRATEDAARATDKKAEPSTVIPSGAPYPLSADKIGRMWRLLNDNGFASFAEA